MMSDTQSALPNNRNIVHEINNPLSFVISNIEMLSKYVTLLNQTITNQSKLIELSKDNFSTQAKTLYQEINHHHETEDLTFVLSDCDALLKESQEGLMKIKKILQEFNQKK